MAASDAISKSIQIGESILHFRSLKIPAGLIIDSVEVRAKNVEVDTHSGRLKLITPAQLTAVVIEEDLRNFLTIKLPIKLSNLELKIEGGRIKLNGSLKMVVSIHANVECDLYIVDQQKVFVRLNSVDVQGVGARSLLQNTLDQINPVFELTDLPVKGSIQRALCENGKVTIFGEITSIFA